MNTRMILAQLIAVVALTLSAHSQGGSPITFHYGPPDSHATFAMAINDAGQVAGGIADGDGGPPGLGMIYQGGQFTIFRYLGGTPEFLEFTIANSINNLGDTVGVFSSAQALADIFFLRHADGTFVNLPLPAGAPRTLVTQPTGINDSRRIVGTYETGTSATAFVAHGFLLKSGILTTLDYPGPGAASVNAGTSSGTYVTGINNAGTIVGYFRSPLTAPKTIGFIYRNGAFSSYQCKVRGKPAATQLLGISNGGEILVSCNGGYFIRKEHGKHLIAINYSSLPHAVITGLNKFGDVVGYYNPADHPSTYYSFIIPGVFH
jgi:hypothetical protein